MITKLLLDERREINELESSRANAEAGFSILEILIGLALIAGIGSIVVTSVMKSAHEGKVQTAKIQMNGFADALKHFRRHCGRYPTTEQGLRALIEKPTSGRECKRYQPGGYLNEDATEIPLDPFDSEYYYVSDGRKFNIASFGTDGVQGGEGEDADVWYKEPSEQDLQ